MTMNKETSLPSFLSLFFFVPIQGACLQPGGCPSLESSHYLICHNGSSIRGGISFVLFSIHLQPTVLHMQWLGPA